ncbi:MAG: NB-ARC domain-containing protein [Cyanobacteria bacterium J06635_15]
MVRSLSVDHQQLKFVRRALQYQPFPSQRSLAADLGVACSTVNRFFTGKSVDYAIFMQLCEVLNLDGVAIAGLDTRADASPSTLSVNSVAAAATGSPEPDGTLRCDWDGAMDVSVFFDRTIELATLKRWITAEGCRLVMLLGMGGIGKTTLSIKLAQMMQADFEVVIWRSLRNAPLALDTLAEVWQILSPQSNVPRFDTVDQGLAQLIPHLRRRRCLWLLDNVESVLQANTGAGPGRYRAGYEGYGQVLQTLGETAHNSCLILTSREHPPGLVARSGTTLPIRYLQLTGLPVTPGQALLTARGQLTGSDADWQHLIHHYAGNPLALKIVAAFVSEFFQGRLAQFLDLLEDAAFIFDDIRDLLDQQFQRLSRLEQSVMYWLAINQAPISLPDLLADFLPPLAPGELLQAIASLQKRSLIDQIDRTVTQQPVVMEYVTHRFIEQIYTELITLIEQPPPPCSPAPLLPCSPAPLLHTHALIKTNVKDSIRHSQTRLILDAIAQRLLPNLSGSAQPLRAVLHHLQSSPVLATGYAGGNLLNLCCHLKLDLSNWDFSRLTLRQAYLQGARLSHLNVAHAEFIQAVFTQTFGNIVAISFSPDGTLLATGDSNNEIRLWQVADGQLLRSLTGHRGWVSAIDFSPDGKTLVSGSVDYTVRLWAVSSGQCLQIWRGHRSVVWSVAFDPSGQRIASGSEDQTAKLWQVSTGKCCRILESKSGWVRAVTFSPAGHTLATGHADGVVRRWNVSTGKCLSRLKGHTAPVWSVAFSPDGQTLASGGGDQTIRLWDVYAEQCLTVLEGHRDQIWSVRFSPDGQRLASGSLDHTIRVWHAETHTCLATLTGHTDQVWSVAFSPDGQTLASGGLDQTIRLWDVKTNQRLHTWHGHTNCIRSVAFHPDGETLASGGDDAIARVWETQTGTSIHTLKGHSSGLWTLAYSPDGQTLATAGFDQTVRLWDAQTGQAQASLGGDAGWVHAIAFHPNSQLLASGHIQPVIHLWDCHTKQCVTTLEGHTDQVWSVAFSPDGQYLASAGADQTVRLWQVETGTCTGSLNGHTDWIYSVAFIPHQTVHAPDFECQTNPGYLLASAGADRTIKLWDVQSGECLRTLEGHTDWVYAIAAHPTGKFLASASYDHTARIWDVQTGDCVHTLTHDAPLWSLAFHPEGHTLACGSQNEMITLWHVDTGIRDKSLQLPQPYEAMNITGTKGLTAAQKSILKALGAVEQRVD